MQVARRTHLLRAIATYDFAPQLSARVRRYLYHPLGVLLLAGLVSLACGLFLHAQGFVLCGGVVVVSALGVMWPWLSLRGLSGTITFDRDRLTEGEEVQIHLTLRNRLPWSAWGLAVTGGFGTGKQPIAAMASVPRRRTAHGRCPFQPPQRGVYPLSPPHLVTGFPFGLWESRRPLVVEQSLIVWPKTFPVGPIPPVSGDHQVEGNVSRSKVGTHGDVLGVRPYRRGDSPRRIHWGQSARHDRLIVCELQSNSRPVIQLVLDIDPLVHAGTGQDSSREWAIRIVASLARGWLNDGAQVGVAWAGHDIPPASGQGQMKAILDALAALPMCNPQPIAEVLACPKCQGFREGLQVIVTTDLAHTHGVCATCSAEDQRWVVLEASAFSQDAPPRACGACPEPWLRIDSIAEIPRQLKSGWREARHGS